MASAPRRSRVTTVSTRDSPLAMAEPFSESEITSAPHRRAASSKDTAVRVEASKKARQTVFPASARSGPPSAWARASSRISRSSCREVFSSVTKFLVSNDDHPILPVGLDQAHEHPLFARGRHVLSDVIRPDGQLPVTAIHQDRESDRGRTPEVQERVHRRARRPAGVENVIDEHDSAPRDLEWHAAPPHLRLLAREVVPV